jgi:hypothetical protein
MKEKKLKKAKAQVEISNNLISTNVVWDQATMDVVADVAQALLNLTQLFTMQNIEIRGINVEQSMEEI